MEINNNILDEDIVESVDSLQLLYEESIGQDNLVSRVAGNSNNSVASQ